MNLTNGYIAICQTNPDFFLLNGETHNQFIKVLLEDVSFIKAFPCQTFVLAIAAIWYYCFQFFILYSYS